MPPQGEPDSLKDQLREVLSNERIFFVDLFRAGIGEEIIRLFREEIKGPGAVRAAVRAEVGQMGKVPTVPGHS